MTFIDVALGFAGLALVVAWLDIRALRDRLFWRGFINHELRELRRKESI